MPITTYTKPEIVFRKENAFVSDYQGFFVDVQNIKYCYRQCYTKYYDVEEEITDEKKQEIRKQFDEWANNLIATEQKLFGTQKHLNAEVLFSHFVEELGPVNVWVYLDRCLWIKKYLSRGHESPFEHGLITYQIRGMSRSASHQFVRCRLSSYNQVSQRYFSEDPDNLKFIIPATIKNDEKANKVVEDFLNTIPAVIKQLKELNVKNEDIRAIYPNATPTDLTVSMNYRELKHLIELRSSKGAQAEIKDIVRRIWLYVSYHMPFIWDGICNVDD